MPIHDQIKEIRATWQELWWGMAGGVTSEYERIKGLDVLEYYKLFDLWGDKVDREREVYKKQTTKPQANARTK